MSHLRLLEPPPTRPTSGGPSLVLTLAPNGAVSPEQDERLAKLARRAIDGDSDALAALHAAYWPRLAHWVRRARRACFRPSADPAIEPSDIVQEAFVVFADLILAWPGERSLSAYVFSVYPWRLSDAVRRMAESPGRHRAGAGAVDALSDESFAASEALTLVRTLAAELPDRHARVLLLRICDGLTWNQIADQLGLTRRTVLRDWQSIRNSLRASLSAAEST